VLGFFVTAPELSHSRLVDYFGGTVMQLFSTLAVLATAAHAWIGMWTVGTDYVRPHYFGRACHGLAARLSGVCLTVLFVYVAAMFWGLRIFWSF
jgi:succinate dehydrogenase / fumarate reductase, membrane anchor subunit